MIKHYALIPAKEKSSRCPDKNWRQFTGDQNLVDYLISIIPDQFFDTVILSTDKQIDSLPHFITVHHRDKQLATTASPINDTIAEVINEYDLDENAYIWLLNPTSPFRRETDFYNILDILEREKPGSVISVTKIHPFLWGNSLGHCMQPLFNTDYPRKNTQDMKTKYAFENGQFIVFKVSEFEKTRTWYTHSTELFEQDRLETMVDIDTEQDFAYAQQLSKGRVVKDTFKNETLMIEDIII